MKTLIKFDNFLAKAPLWKLFIVNLIIFTIVCLSTMWILVDEYDFIFMKSCLTLGCLIALLVTIVSHQQRGENKKESK